MLLSLALFLPFVEHLHHWMVPSRPRNRRHLVKLQDALTHPHPVRWKKWRQPSLISLGMGSTEDLKGNGGWTSRQEEECGVHWSISWESWWVEELWSTGNRDIQRAPRCKTDWVEEGGLKKRSTNKLEKGCCVKRVSGLYLLGASTLLIHSQMRDHGS